MKTDKLENTLQEILSLAGIKINGNNPWDIKVIMRSFIRES